MVRMHCGREVERLTVRGCWRAVGPRVVVEAGEALVVAAVSDGDVHGAAAAQATAASGQIPSRTLCRMCF